jgi:hypothetical protein
MLSSKNSMITDGGETTVKSSSINLKRIHDWNFDVTKISSTEVLCDIAKTIFISIGIINAMTMHNFIFLKPFSNRSS